MNTEERLKMVDVRLTELCNSLIEGSWTDPDYHRDYLILLSEGYSTDIAETKAMEMNK